MSMKLSLLIYKKLCEILLLLLNAMTMPRYNIPAPELTKCTVMQLGLSGFLNLLTSQMNTFILTRAAEFARFTDAFEVMN